MTRHALLPSKKRKYLGGSKKEIIPVNSTADYEDLNATVADIVPVKGKNKRRKVSQETQPSQKPSKKQSCKVKDNEDVEASVLTSIRFRTTPAQLAAVMISLNPKQQECVRQFGFGSLLGFDISKLPGKLVYYVVDKFDSSEMVIRTAKGDIKCDRDAVYDVFGIPKGDVDISSLQYKVDADFINKWLGQFPSPNIRPSQIKTKIFNSDGATDDLFKMNILMLFANTMVSSESNGLCKFDVLNYVSKETDVASLDWCGFLLKSLEFSKNQWHRDDVNKNFYAGPATFLTLLYVDRTKCDGVPVCRQRPIFKNWNRFLSIRDYKEAALGSYGLMEHWPPYEEDKDTGEGFLLIEDSKEEELDEKKDYYKFIEEKLDVVSKIKKLLLRTFKEGLSKFPDDENLRGYYRKMDDVFCLKKGLDDEEEDSKKKIDEEWGCLNKGVGSDDVNDAKKAIDEVVEGLSYFFEKAELKDLKDAQFNFYFGDDPYKKVHDVKKDDTKDVGVGVGDKKAVGDEDKKAGDDEDNKAAGDENKVSGDEKMGVDDSRKTKRKRELLITKGV